MASSTSDGGARLKEKARRSTGFGRFLVDLTKSLTNDDIRLLMTAMEFKTAERDKVERSENPGYEFISFLKKKGIMSRTDISDLTEKLRFCGLHGIENDVQDSFKRYQNHNSWTEEYDQGFRHFLLTLELLLTRSQACKLATFFEYPAELIDSISNSDTPSQALIQFMHERGDLDYSFRSTMKLVDALKHETVGLGCVAVKVERALGYFSKVHTTPAPIAHPIPVINEKKTQFVTELKNKYKNLCGGIQPAPFLRDRYDIDKLFVESGIEFFDKERGGERWKELKNYKMVFTDPQIKSKRRIIDGEPGYGKSTLALQITHDWCQELPPMKDFEILILLRLRHLRSVPTVYSAIKKFLLPKDSTLTEDDFKGILDSSSTVILLDGYDEYPDRGNEDTDIEHIIRGDMFQKHEVVLTTRTSCLPPKCSSDTKRIRLTGFDDAARETYIRNVVGRGCSDDANKISQFFKENPVPSYFCKSPLFFAMMSYMVKNSEKFRNLKTVTQFFRHIIQCFHSHKEIKVSEGNREEELDHSKLDQVSYVRLIYKITWEKNNLRGKIGKDLYDEYVRIGILIEEEVFDYDTLEYKTETRFFHKLFAEWYAAHYLAKVAAHPKAEFKSWKNQMCLSSESKPDPHMLSSLDLHDVHYMYRYACGLDRDAARKIIEHVGTNEYYNQYTLLCIREWGGHLEEILNTVCRLCSRSVNISDTDSLLLTDSTVELIKYASFRKIPISSLKLWDCLDSGFLSKGNLRLKSTNLSLPIMATLRKLEIYEYGREITEEETGGILQYSVMCLGLKELLFGYCLLPRYIKVSESLSVLSTRDVKVKCLPDLRTSYVLNLKSGQWEFGGETPMTDVLYERELKAVRQLAEWRKQRLGKDQ